MENWNKVDKTEQSENTKKTANKANKLIVGTSIAGLALFIITSSISNKLATKSYEKPTTSYEVSTDEAATIKKPVETKTEAPVEETNDISSMAINYSGATSFYNEINNARNNNNNCFTNVFQTEEEVNDYVKFITYFDTNYEVERPETIKTLDDFNAITDSYYADCANYNIKPTINTLFNNNEYMQKKVAKVEELANNLQGTSGSDYTKANEYYSELVNDLCTESGINTSNVVNCPCCEIIISICKNYNHVGNAYQARQNEKTVNLIDMTNTLNIANVDDEYVCPDSAYKSIVNEIKIPIDEQIISNYETQERSK